VSSAGTAPSTQDMSSCLLVSSKHWTPSSIVLRYGPRPDEAAIIRPSFGTAGASVDLFRRKLCLTSDATNYCVSPALGPSAVVYALYRKVYSMMTFVGKNGTCVAPGCRRFSRRVGYVVMAHRFRDSFPVSGHQETADVEGGDNARPTLTSYGGPQYVTNEEEDEGLEKLPSDTL